MPSWLQIQKDDSYIPKKMHADKSIKNLKDVKITDITQYYLNEDMHEELKAVTMMKEDYKKLKSQRPTFEIIKVD